MVRTRFAPSPTGHLHIGGARTALFSWLYARKTGATFILRIEDTDRQRSSPESIDAILRSMDWLGLDYDEGPFYQTHRFDRYREVTDKLLDSGHAYYCDCSRERLDSLRELQKSQNIKPRYDGCCREKGLPASEKTVVRFRNPDEGDVIIEDAVKGRVVINNRELDDLVIQRSDGTPTYNFTVVVDDNDMNITHVVRGDDHLNNTPRQINILNALGAALPVYAHVPMILGSDGKRLSKRHGAVSVMQYFDDGYLPDALMNYLVRLGWSHGDQEIFSRDEMTKCFDLPGINKAPSTFNPEKLLWVNQQYIQAEPASSLAGALKVELESQGIKTDDGPDIMALVEILRERNKTIVEMANDCAWFYRDFEKFNEKAAKKHFRSGSVPVLNELLLRFDGLADWNAENIHKQIVDVAEIMDLNMGKVGMPLRLAVTGGTSSPSIDITVEYLGRERTLKRIRRALEYIQSLEVA